MISQHAVSSQSPDLRGTCKISCMGGAASSLPAICRRMGNEDVAPPWFCKCLKNLSIMLVRNTLNCLQFNNNQTFNDQISKIFTKTKSIAVKNPQRFLHLNKETGFTKTVY